jgi:hypothetical protein
MTSNTVRFAMGAVVLFAEVGCVSREELRAHDAAACTSYGFQQGTREFAACVERENLSRIYWWSSPYP